MKHDAVRLAQQIIRYQSLNPPGDEKECSDFIAAYLTDAGFDVKAYEFASGRPTLIARIQGTEDLKPLCFTGHIDVVPLGGNEWRYPPFGGEIADGRLHGRGASDMKAGVAAFMAAACKLQEERPTFRRGITFIITAGEETGCEGAFHVGREGVLGAAELLIVAEPTSNAPVFAHKGSLRVVVSASGKAAHSSMPEEGENAVLKCASWIDKLARHDFPGRHPLLGPTTACVTTVRGGENINSVPDFAQFTVDFRTIPEQSHDQLLRDLAEMFGQDAKIEVVTDFRGFSTDPSDISAAPLLQLLEERTGQPVKLAGAPYFTDASALVPAFDNAATVVIGPGEAAQCHKTDEFCFVDRIVESQKIYEDLIRSMCF